MATEVEICQLALDQLGDYAISDLKEDSKQARLCDRNYPRARDAVLRAHPWNCALTRAALSKDTEAPAFGWAFQYTLPRDCLRVIPLTQDGVPNADPIVHEVEGRKILTNADAPLPVRYIRRAEASVFDPMLVQAIAMQLAFIIAFNLTGSRSKQDDALAQYRLVMRSARRIDGMEGTPEEQVLPSTWERARR